MDIEKQLILIKDEDKTDDVSYCNYNNGKWHVKFNKGDRFYTYNYANVQWLKNPVFLDPDKTVVYHQNQPLTGIHKIFDFGNYIRICYATGYKQTYRRQELTVEQSCLSNRDANNCFEYLKQLAEHVSVITEQDRSFLSKQYAKLSCVSPSSVLAKYLYPAKLQSMRQVPLPVFPFGFNLSQKSATEKALAEQISVIEGPPGTGKTQTILNIIANAVINGKTVAVVSNNNSATANVLEKLQQYGVEFVAAYLGNKHNKLKFLAEQTRAYPEMQAWGLTSDQISAIRTVIVDSGKELNQMHKIKNELAAFKQERLDLLVEKKYFDAFYNESCHKILPYRSIFRHNSATVMALWLDYQQTVEQNGAVSLRFILKSFLRYGVYSLSFYRYTTENIIGFFQNHYYRLKLDELSKHIDSLTGRLERYKFEHAMQEYSQNSMRLFKAKLAERYSNKMERKVFTEEALWKEFDVFIKEYPVVLSTTHSLRNCVTPNYLFDYVIIDEASQVDIVSGALALSSAKNCVIVGDLMQLPNVVPWKTAEVTNMIFGRFKLNHAYHYGDNSILSSITKLYESVPRTLLREHYRCHPKIIGFCNQKFYHNQLIVLTEENGREKPLVAYKTAKGNHARGKYNQRQIDVIREEVLPGQGLDINKQSIGIVSPYRLQTEKLKEAMGEQGFEIDTVHKYQGRERDVIILTTVVNEINEFVDNPNLLNVAVSRAVDKLIIVVSDNEKNENTNVGDLIRYIDYNNFEVTNSKIYSVFDLLYSSYSRHLAAIMRNRKIVSEYESENLMNAIIEKVLDLTEFHNLGRIMHQPLKMLIRNPEILDENEYRYAMNVLTHTDFVIFNKLNKMPVLVVEVDGYAYHENNPKQLQRDKMKDAILKKHGIPILRLKTNESGEERRLVNKLKQIFNFDG